MALSVGINGLGRIGRMVLRRAVTCPNIEVVAVNACHPPATLAHLLTFDTVHGRFVHDVGVEGDSLQLADRRIRCLSERSPRALPWKELGVEVVVEATGCFVHREGAAGHLVAGAERVVVTAPGKDLDATLVMGVNHDRYDPQQHQLLSAASCTTNALAPIVKVLHRYFGIEYGLLTTVHAYTNDQQLLDNPHKDLRRARASSLTLIPTKTGAAEAIGEVIPELAGRLHGLAVRVPVPNVSLLDLVVHLTQPVDRSRINEVLQMAAGGEFLGYLSFVEAPLVSADCNGDPHSAIVDGLLTTVVGDHQAKILAWYDNEWGYACRVVDLLHYIHGMTMGGSPQPLPIHM
ncbi:type I glyceraldehyde-3-phosphate dehydrogenase [Pasteuria penetrans]|uniref:type I glyceraldehyde-3-phosphate dehydrogenase n=1 Tax=Pasteuria penetrans TaxID=86005 RepID=UPI000F91D7B6|nr:type I glyceraldehyde-3-phosphate dehydrogenase [Pasteuria penetrans]